jgi:hypothetical protein
MKTAHEERYLRNLQPKNNGQLDCLLNPKITSD